MALHMLYVRYLNVMIFSTVMPGPAWIRPRPTAGCGGLKRKVESGRHFVFAVFSPVYIMGRREQRERERKRAAESCQMLYRFMSDSSKKSKQDDTCCSEPDCGTAGRYSRSFIV